MQVLIWALVLALLANVTIALVTVARRPGTHLWLLVLLLTGTTGAAAAPLVALGAGRGAGEVVDVSLILVGLALVTTIVLAATRYARRDREQQERRAGTR